MNYDKILEKCGDYGRYQLMILGLYGFLCFFVSQHYFGQTMISFVPDHWCYHPKLANRTYDEIKTIYSNFERPSCTYLDDIINGSAIPSKKPCTQWIYNYDYGYRSMNTEFNWVCDSAYVSVYGQSFFFVGSVVGTLIFGIMADRYGRLRLLVLANICSVIGDIATTFSTEIITFSISRFVSGMAVDTNIYLMYIIVLEYIEPSKRIMTLNLVIGIFYTGGQVISPWVAVVVGNWKLYLISITAPLVLVFTFLYMVNESAQWLITQNNINGAIRRLKKVAKFNRMKVDDSNFVEFAKFCELETLRQIDKSTANFFDLFKRPRQRIRTMILFYVLTVTTLCFNVVSRNVEGSGLSPFILFSVSSVTVFPAAGVLIVLQNKIGRKGMAISSALFCSVISATTGISLWTEDSNNKNVILLATLQILSRFGIALAYESSNQYATELIPTCVRGQGVAALHVAGYAVSFLSLPVLYLSSVFSALPSVILTILFLSEAVFMVFLPETLNKVLPKTIEEGEFFSKNEGVFEFVCFKRHLSKNVIS